MDKLYKAGSFLFGPLSAVLEQILEKTQFTLRWPNNIGKLKIQNCTSIGLESQIIDCRVMTLEQESQEYHMAE